MNEKFILNSPVILEDLMENVENILIQKMTTQLTCAKCAEEIIIDFLKDTVFLSCKHVIHYNCIDNSHKKYPTCLAKDLVLFPVEQTM